MSFKFKEGKLGEDEALSATCSHCGFEKFRVITLVGQVHPHYLCGRCNMLFCHSDCDKHPEPPVTVQ